MCGKLHTLDWLPLTGCISGTCVPMLKLSGGQSINPFLHQICRVSRSQWSAQAFDTGQSKPNISGTTVALSTMMTTMTMTTTVTREDASQPAFRGSMPLKIVRCPVRESHFSGLTHQCCVFHGFKRGGGSCSQNPGGMSALLRVGNSAMLFYI